jgi:hypothetical protein
VNDLPTLNRPYGALLHLIFNGYSVCDNSNSGVIEMRVIQIIIFITFLSPAFAQDWTQWRGANRDGQVQGFVAPKTWPEKLTQR